MSLRRTQHYQATQSTQPYVLQGSQHASVLQGAADLAGTSALDLVVERSFGSFFLPPTAGLEGQGSSQPVDPIASATVAGSTAQPNSTQQQHILDGDISFFPAEPRRQTQVNLPALSTGPAVTPDLQGPGSTTACGTTEDVQDDGTTPPLGVTTTSGGPGKEATAGMAHFGIFYPNRGKSRQVPGLAFRSTCSCN